MKLLLTADLHLTSNPRDEYRWGLRGWLETQIVEHDVDSIVIAGDITDSKDRHDAQLVNRFVGDIEILRATGVARLFVLAGNHDGVNPRVPFFKFLPMIYEPNAYMLGKKNVLFLPCTRDYKTDWKGLNFSPYDYIFAHQTFDGAKSENGTALEGIPPSVFKNTKAKVWSGDIHVPQKINKQIEYIGAPYHIRFGDAFVPRVVLLDLETGKSTDLHYPCLKRHLAVVDCVESFQTWIDVVSPKGDQAKVRVDLIREDRPDWNSIKKKIQQLAEDNEIDLCGGIELLPLKDIARTRKRHEKLETGKNDFTKLVSEYAKKNKLDAKVGQEFLNG